jgi:iron complex transport system substrate-binding protein
MKKQILSFTALLLALLLAGCAASAPQSGSAASASASASGAQPESPAARMRGPSRSTTRWAVP